MSEPFLASKSSGYGGRGYVDPFTEGKPTLPSVTTILRAIASEGIVQWAVNQTALYYAANPEAVLSRDVEGVYNLGRFYAKRTPDFDSPEYNPFNFHKGVLDDAADLGTWIHTFVEATFNDWMEPTPQNVQHEQMAEAFILWYNDNDVKIKTTEHTVFGHGYAGTFDFIGDINGTVYLGDTKSSAAVHNSHRAQLGGLGAAHTMAVLTDEFDMEAVPHTKTIDGVKVTKFFRPEPLPSFTNYGVLQIRPDDEVRGKEAFCEFHVIDNAVIDAGFDMFKGALAIKQAEYLLKTLLKEG